MNSVGRMGSVMRTMAHRFVGFGHAEDECPHIFAASWHVLSERPNRERTLFIQIVEAQKFTETAVHGTRSRSNV